MEADDDQRWLDVLAGRIPPRADDAVMQQAQALRIALRATPQPLPAGELSSADQRITQLLARARAQGVLNPPARPRLLPAFLDGLWSIRGPWVAPAMGLVLVAGLLSLWWPAHQESGNEAVLRGAPPAVQHLPSSDPLASQAALADALQRAGAQVQPFERLGRHGLDIELPQPLPATLRQLLQQHGLQTPTGTALVIEFDEHPLPASPTASTP